MSEARLAVAEQHIETLDERLRDLQKDVREIRDSLHKQRGFVAGFSAAFSLLWAALAGVGVALWRHITGGG